MTFNRNVRYFKRNLRDLATGNDWWKPEHGNLRDRGFTEVMVKSDGWSTDYYKIPEGAKELQDLIEHKHMNFAIGNIFKACYRLGNKEGTDGLYDIRKIIWYAQRELARLEKNNNNEPEREAARAVSG